MIVNQVGGDINPAEPVCEYPETHLPGVAVLEKVNLFSFYISSCSVQKLMTLLRYCERLHALQLPADLPAFWFTSSVIKHLISSTAMCCCYSCHLLSSSDTDPHY